MTGKLDLARSAAAALLFCACSHTQPVELRVDAPTPHGSNAMARIAVPKQWRALAPSASRAEFLGPDNRSRAYFRATPVQDGDLSRCPDLVEQYANDVITSWGYSPKKANKARAPDGLQFEIRRADPKPEGEVIWSRVACRDGVLAIAQCAVPKPRERELRSICQDMLESLEITPRVRDEHARRR